MKKEGNRSITVNELLDIELDNVYGGVNSEIPESGSSDIVLNTQQNSSPNIILNSPVNSLGLEPTDTSTAETIQLDLSKH